MRHVITMQKYYFYEDRKRLPGLYFSRGVGKRLRRSQPAAQAPAGRETGAAGTRGAGRRGCPSGGVCRGQYLKLLPPMNSRRMDVGGISSGGMGVKFFRNLSMRRASSYSGSVSGMS